MGFTDPSVADPSRRFSIMTISPRRGGSLSRFPKTIPSPRTFQGNRDLRVRNILINGINGEGGPDGEDEILHARRPRPLTPMAWNGNPVGQLRWQGRSGLFRYRNPGWSIRVKTAGLILGVFGAIFTGSGLGVPDRRGGAVETAPFLLFREKFSIHALPTSLYYRAEISSSTPHRPDFSVPV
uniref:Uncharacterized protein n=1 Tax=Candidatus Kentrum sp. DK TaxID=2126562 RepID=A0A450SGI0_9GAMM|nr:MAG: hypothetical protein BECKDK2373B_GA0170837_10362 [Candidatus Kentron sp. DK]